MDSTWGFTSGEWVALTAVATVATAAFTFLTALVSLRTAKVSARVAARMHRESGPVPALSVWTHRDTSSEEVEGGRSIVLEVRVENLGRTDCEVSPPFISRSRSGWLVVESSFQWEGPTDRQRLAPSAFASWWLPLDALPEGFTSQDIVRVWVETRASGGARLSQKIQLGTPQDLKSRLRLAAPWT